MNPFQKILRMAVLALAILVLTAGLASTTATAKTLTVGTGTGTAGQTPEVLIPITINDPTGVGGIAFTITYNPAALTFLGLSQATTSGWPIKDPEAFKVTTDPVTGYPYYNPYKKEDPYATRDYTLTANATLFYQFNDVKDAQSNPMGRVLVSGASADPLTGTTLFTARFQIKSAAVGGTIYPVRIFRSIINNPAAGYTADTFLPVLVGTGDKVDGLYTTLNFPEIPATLVAGGISISATAYKIGGKVTYGTSTGNPAAGCTVTLYKETAPNSGSYVFREQTTVGATGTYAFFNKYPGNFKIAVQSLNPGYDNYASPVIPLTNADITADAILLAKPTPDYVKGTVTGTFPAGLLVKVVDPNAKVMGTYSVGADGKWSSGLLPPLTSGSYGWYLVYGSLTSAKDATTFGVAVLKTISGTISGLPDSGGAVTASSAAGKITKTLKVTKTGADTSYTITDLVAANDYIVSSVATGLPLTYYNGKTDVNEATRVDISAGNETGIDFNFVPPVSSITGAITDSGQGVVGTTVYGFEVDAFSLISTTTGADGAYSLSVPKGTYEVFVIKNNGKIFYFYNEDGTPTQNQGNALLRTVSSDGQTVENTNINITECDKTLIGKVTYRSESGDPAANLLISVSNVTKRALGLTGQDGKYTVGGLCDGVAYTVDMKPLVGNYAVQSTSIVAGTDTTKDFIIDTGAVLSGTVTDQISSDAVSGAMLYLKDQTTGALVGGRIYFSAQDGKYSIGDIRSGSYTIEVTHPDYKVYTAAFLIGADDVAKDIPLEKGANFKGTVTATGKALAGATIIVTRAGAASLYTVTDSVGFYSVYGLDATKSDYIVIAQKRGYERQAETLKQPSTAGTTVDFALVPPTTYYTVSGTVKTNASSGAEISGAIVLVSSAAKNFFASTTTVANGTYLVGNLIASSDYRIVVIPPGLPTQESTFTVGPSATKDFTISLGKDIDGKITGDVTIPAGAKIYVFLYKESTYKGFVMAGTDGSFRFKGITVDGIDYKVLAVATGYTPQWYNGKTRLDTATLIDITGMSQTGVDITLIKK